VLPIADGAYTLVDGEHRWRAARDAGITHVPCIVLPASRDEAMLDTIRMNQLRGNAIPIKMALVIADLSKRIPLDALERELGFEEHELSDQLELLKLPDDIGKTIELQAEMEEREAFQVVTFVMRKPQAELIERTVDQLEKELGGPNPRGRALDHIVRKYLEATGQLASEPEHAPALQ
jgi:ParB family chromosome partitioning protein